MIRVEVFQTSDGTWYLQSYHVITMQVYMLLPFGRLIELLDAACMMQLRIDNKLALEQYYIAHDTGLFFDLAM